MGLVITPEAGNDLESIKDKGDVNRISRKIDQIQNKIESGLDPDKVIEKRLSGNWNPILQQRVGNYRLWFVEGENTEKGSETQFIY